MNPAPRRTEGWPTEIGEGFAGDGPNAAHVNTVLGEREGAVGTAWATALATPRAGHIPFVAVLRPNLPVKPLTLFVNKAPLSDERHERLTWGAAQAGVAAGVADAVADGTVGPDRAESALLIAAVWVDPAASDETEVFGHNRQATHAALLAGSRGDPSLAEVLAARAAPTNPFFGGR